MTKQQPNKTDLKIESRNVFKRFLIGTGLFFLCEANAGSSKAQIQCWMEHWRPGPPPVHSISKSELLEDGILSMSLQGFQADVLTMKECPDSNKTQDSQSRCWDSALSLRLFKNGIQAQTSIALHQSQLETTVSLFLDLGNENADLHCSGASDPR